MKSAALLLVLGLFGLALCDYSLPQRAPSSQNSNVGAAISTETIQYLLNLIVPPILYKELSLVGNDLPQTCCYQTKAKERMYLENLSINPDSISTSFSVSDGKIGPNVEAFLNFDITLFYKLCSEGLVGCTQGPAEYPCKGDATLGVRTKTSVDVDLTAGPNGQPNLSFKHFKFHLDVSKKGICFLLKGLLDSAMPFINVFLQAFLPHILEPLVSEIPLPNNFTLPGPVPLDINWYLTNGTGSKVSGVAAQGIFDILIKSLGYKKAPFYPRYPLPPAADKIAEGTNTIDVTDSLINNVLYTGYRHFQDFEFDTKQKTFKIKLTIPSSPVVNFTSTGGVLTVYTHASLTRLPLKIIANTVETIKFDIAFNSQGHLYLVLDPNLIVDITSITPPQPAAEKKKIEELIEGVWAEYIPAINAKLAAHPFAIPAPPEAHSPVINYYNGYAELKFLTTPKRSSNTSRIDRDVVEGTVVDPSDVFDVTAVLQHRADLFVAPAFLHLFQALWEATYTPDPYTDLLPVIQHGLPEGSRNLGCPGLPLFQSC